jgi:hypothetical protein
MADCPEAGLETILLAVESWAEFATVSIRARSGSTLMATLLRDRVDSKQYANSGLRLLQLRFYLQ